MFRKAPWLLIPSSVKKLLRFGWPFTAGNEKSPIGLCVPPPEFAGLWQLDVKESDTLQQKLEAMRGSGSGGGFPGGGGWHGGTGGGWPGPSSAFG